MTTKLPVPPSLAIGYEVDLEESAKFWGSSDVVYFFKKHGYILYEQLASEDGSLSPGSRPALTPCETLQPPDYPYACHDANHGGPASIPLLARDWTGKIVFGQDIFGRHVAVKIIREGSNEHSVLEFLIKQPHVVLQENCIIPILELIPIQGFSFAVMPRWGDLVLDPAPESIYEVFDFMRALLKVNIEIMDLLLAMSAVWTNLKHLLKGLTFLHGNNITHGDLKLGNILVDHFCNADAQHSSSIRRELREQQILSYALCDFDASFIFPAKMDREQCRLEIERSRDVLSSVKDNIEGEFDYNPFAFDVGNLGAMFCEYFQHLTPTAPFMAPLLDMMTTRDLKRRFSASEALDFFERMLSEVPQEKLKTRIRAACPEEYAPYDEYDRWEHIPSDFVIRWAAYREPPLPWMAVFLRWICQYAVGSLVVAWLRRFFFMAVTIISKIVDC